MTCRLSPSSKVGVLATSLLFITVLPQCYSDSGTLLQEGDTTTQTTGTQTVGDEEKPSETAPKSESKELAVATFAGGCFWCVEAVFEELDGVHEVVSGYEGGKIRNPTYDQVCSGTTGHAEVCRVEYDPEIVEFEKLLMVFFTTHDPTTLNRQGNDVGTQYRSAIFYHDEEQKKISEDVIQRLEEAKAFRGKIVTEVVPTERFYAAEDYHQDYFANNPSNRYCAAIIPPKLEKLKKVFGDDLKGKEK